MKTRFAPAVLVAVATLGWACEARAQACCAASQASGPTRLSAGQLATAGIGVDFRLYRGAFIGRDYRPIEHANYEFRQTLFGAVAPFEDWQFGITASAVQSLIRTGYTDDAGGGIGDVGMQARYQLADTPNGSAWPDIGLIASVTAPTGRSRTDSMRRSDHQLQADVTGGESWRLEVGTETQWAWQHWFVVGQTSTYQGLTYTDHRGADVRPGPGFRGRVSTGRTFDVGLFEDDNLVVGAGAVYTHQLRDRRGGAVVDRSVEGLTTVSGQVGGYLSKFLHVMVTGSTDLTIDGTGNNRHTGAQLGIRIRGVWTEY